VSLKADPGPSQFGKSSSMILVIGELWRWEREGRRVPSMDGFRFVSFSTLSHAHLHDPRPELVVSALMGEEFDVVDVATRLSNLGYVGRYRAVMKQPLPDPDMVHDEVRQVAPQIDFGLLLLSDDL
jgi:hypothetical protein